MLGYYQRLHGREALDYARRTGVPLNLYGFVLPRITITVEYGVSVTGTEWVPGASGLSIADGEEAIVEDAGELLWVDAVPGVMA